MCFLTSQLLGTAPRSLPILSLTQCAKLLVCGPQQRVQAQGPDEVLLGISGAPPQTTDAAQQVVPGSTIGHLGEEEGDSDKQVAPRSTVETLAGSRKQVGHVKDRPTGL